MHTMAADVCNCVQASNLSSSLYSITAVYQSKSSIEHGLEIECCFSRRPHHRIDELNAENSKQPSTCTVFTNFATVHSFWQIIYTFGQWLVRNSAWKRRQSIFSSCCCWRNCHKIFNEDDMLRFQLRNHDVIYRERESYSGKGAIAGRQTSRALLESTRAAKILSRRNEPRRVSPAQLPSPINNRDCD